VFIPPPLSGDGRAGSIRVSRQDLRARHVRCLGAAVARSVGRAGRIYSKSAVWGDPERDGPEDEIRLDRLTQGRLSGVVSANRISGLPVSGWRHPVRIGGHNPVPGLCGANAKEVRLQRRQGKKYSFKVELRKARCMIRAHAREFARRNWARGVEKTVRWWSWSG
jgi:hypothetical protein